MAALLPLLAFLLVGGSGGDRLATAALGTDDATVPYYSSASEVIAYWQTALPNSPMPAAVAEHLNACTDNQKITVQQDLHGEREDERTTLGWGSSPKEHHEMKGDDGRVTFRWGPYRERDDEKVTSRWGRLRHHGVGDDESVAFKINPPIEERDEKVTFHWGPRGTSQAPDVLGRRREEDTDHKVTFNWAASRKTKGDQKVTLGWGPRSMDDEHVEKRIGDANRGDDHKVTLAWRSSSEDPNTAASLLFLEAVLTRGTLIAPYIEPSVSSPAPFLRREAAAVIPISTKNFTDILSMFAPASLAMAGEIWSTLRTCERPPPPLPGERRACAASVEAMVELAAAVLGTRDLRAFSSSPDVPAAGVDAAVVKYRVAAVRAVTVPGEEATTMTCHSVTFPYAVFYCHAVNPTTVYEVALRRTDGGGEEGLPATMRALAVCHLDTSGFDPELGFFLERGLKPGDAPVCHFLSRDSVLWAPAASSRGPVVAQ